MSRGSPDFQTLRAISNRILMAGMAPSSLEGSQEFPMFIIFQVFSQVWIEILQIHPPVGGDWNMAFIFPSDLGMSSSQLTNSYFSEGFGQPPTSPCLMDQEPHVPPMIVTKNPGAFWRLVVLKRISRSGKPSSQPSRGVLMRNRDSSSQGFNHPQNSQTYVSVNYNLTVTSL